MVIETDHKPLVQLLTKKQVESLPLRILFSVAVKRLDYHMDHVPCAWEVVAHCIYSF